MRKRNSRLGIFSAALSLLLLLCVLFGCATNPNLGAITTSAAYSNREPSIKEEIMADDIVVLFTNDVHCAISDNIGYSGLAAYKNTLGELTSNVTLVDCGDAVQGDTVGAVSRGEFAVELMNAVGYDFAVLGNHEFDYGMPQLKKLIDLSNAQYLACNISYNGDGENALSEVAPYKIVQYGEVKVAYIGVSTPDTIKSSTPTAFMENGEFVYDFCGGDSSKLYTKVQKTIDACNDAGANYIIALTHLGDSEEESLYTSKKLAEATSGIDAILDGHAHSTISCETLTDKNGDYVLLSSTGAELNAIGQLIITKNGDLNISLINAKGSRDREVATLIEQIKSRYEQQMNTIVATSNVNLSVNDENGVRLVRSREAAIGNLCADAYRITSGADIAFVNGGGIRADLKSGNITYGDIIAVHPYGNSLCVVEATGAEILDALEMACMKTTSEYKDTNGNAVGESGAFMHVSGLKYTVDTSVASSVTLDENGMFVSCGDTRRVTDVLVLQGDTYVALDPQKTYTLASHDYLIKSGGDGMNMFMDNNLTINDGAADYQTLISYITVYLGGQIGEQYATTEGRITVK